MNKSLRPIGSFFDDLGPFKPGFVDAFFDDRHWMPTFATKPFKNDIIEFDDRFEVKAELPGCKKEDISVKVVDGFLRVEANKNEKKEETKDGKVIRKEIYSGSISRSFALDGIDADNVKASFADGILKLTLPKLQKVEEKETGKKIDIE